MTFAQLRESILVVGEDWIPGWDEVWRRYLLDNLETLVQSLWVIGMETIFVDGSFCSAKPRPGDIDAFYELPLPETINEIKDEKERRTFILTYVTVISEQLNQFFGAPIWNIWDKMHVDEYGNAHTEMWRMYKCELYPSCWGVYAGGLYPNGRKLKFDEYFRFDQDGIPKGMIQLVKG
jgi:hypothetical protein